MTPDVKTEETMSDTQPSQRALGDIKPDEKPTVAIAPPPAWAIDLSQRVADGFRLVNSDLEGIKLRQELHATQVKDLGGEIARVGDRVKVLEDARATNSIRAREPSAHDIELKNEVDSEKQAREALAAEVAETKRMLAENNEATIAIKKAVVGVTTNPKVKTAAKALFYLIVAAAAAKGWVLK